MYCPWYWSTLYQVQLLGVVVLYIRPKCLYFAIIVLCLELESEQISMSSSSSSQVLVVVVEAS